MIMNDFWIFGKVCFNLIGRDRLVCGGGDNHTKKDSTINTLPFFFWVRAGNSQFIEERGLFSHFCPLLSLSLRFCPLFFHEHVKWNRSFLYPYQVWQCWEQPEDLWNKFSFLDEFCPGLTRRAVWRLCH